MALGANRDYKTRDRSIRRNFAVVHAQADKLAAQGISEPFAQAMADFKNGLLEAELKAWQDPILAHSRAMRAKNNA